MSGYQFLRIDTYAMSVPKLRLQREADRRQLGKEFERKLSVEEICFEAARVPGNHQHIVEPAPPVVLYGIPPDQIPAWLQARIDKQNAFIAAQKKAMPRGTRRGGPRAIRTDSPTLIAIVGSHPFFTKGDGTDYPSLDDPECRAAVEDWKAGWVRWKLEDAAERGAIVISIVEHVDEGHPHLHAFEIADNPRLDARAVHPGFAAKRAVEAIEGEAEKETTERANTAYKAAMALWQDDHHARVSVDHGLLRVGPRRRRLRRKVYLEEKKAADGVARGRAAEAREAEAHAAAAEVRRLETAKDEVKRAGVANVIDRLVDKAGDVAATVTLLENRKRSLEDLTVAASTALADILAAKERAVAENGEQRRLASERLSQLVEAGTVAESDLERKRKDLENVEAVIAALVERDRLQKAKEERLESERTEIVRQREELEQEQVSRREKQRELDAKLLGLDAFFDGRLFVIPRPGQRPALQCHQAHADLQPALMPAVEWLRDRLYSLHVARRKTKLLASAIIRAARAWATGEISCVVPDRTTRDGKAVFGGLNAEPSKELLASLDPYHKAVAALITSLPDRVAIDHIQFHASELTPYLDAAAKKHALELNGRVANLARLAATRPPGRGGAGR